MPKGSALAEPWRVYSERAVAAKKAKDAALALRDLIRAGSPVSDHDLRSRDMAMHDLEEEATLADNAYLAAQNIATAIEKAEAKPAPSPAPAVSVK